MARTLNVIAFPGAPNLPTFAAIEQGYFAEVGLEVNLVTTPSSVYQFEAFGRGDFDLAFTAFDNVVAYDEGQGAVKLAHRPDFRALMGATQIGLSAIVAPEIETAADLRGKTLALDAVGTGFAFVLYDMLAKLGMPRDAYEPVPVGATPERWAAVKAGAHAGTITIEPFTSLAKAAGFKVLAQSRDAFPAPGRRDRRPSRLGRGAPRGDCGLPRRLPEGGALDARSRQPRGRIGPSRHAHARDQAGHGWRGDGEPALARDRAHPGRRTPARRHGGGARSALALWPRRKRAGGRGEIPMARAYRQARAALEG